MQVESSWTSIPIPDEAIAHVLLAGITWYNSTLKHVSMPGMRVFPGIGGGEGVRERPTVRAKGEKPHNRRTA